MNPILVTITGTLLWLTWVEKAQGQTHWSCHRCKCLYEHSQKGAGFARDCSGLCPKCKLQILKTSDSLSWFEINDFRYLYFENGTLIDLKHFRGSSLLSWHHPLGFAPAIAVGWSIEKLQEHNGHPSGHPEGTNEDMLSNEMGAFFGSSKHFSPFSNDTWTSDALSFLEFQFGPLVRVSDRNPN